MNPLGSVKGTNVLAIMVLAIMATGAWLLWHVRQDNPRPLPARPEKPAFDFYLLALTWHAAFCADGNVRKAECQVRAARPLVIHGLWPENLEPRTYPHDCQAPRLQLDPGFVRLLEEHMPGVRSGLHEHEWREHGSCSGLPGSVYFTRTLEFARHMDAALAARLTTMAGTETTAAELRAAADTVRPGLGATFTLHCRNLRNAPAEYRDRPFLVEIRQCIENDGPEGAPGTVFGCALVNRHDQGCGTRFRIASLR